MAARSCKSSQTLMEDCTACLQDFPLDIGSGQIINEPLKLLLFCQSNDLVEKVLAAIKCMQACRGLPGAETEGSKDMTSLASEVDMAQTAVKNLVVPALEMVAAALEGSSTPGVATSVTVTSVCSANVLKHCWKLARACKAGQGDDYKFSVTFLIRLIRLIRLNHLNLNNLI